MSNKNYYEEISLYDIEKLKLLFKGNKVVAYGNGSFYIKVKEFIEELGFEFDDVLYSENFKIISSSGREYEEIVMDSLILICSSFYEDIIELIKKQRIQPKSIKISSFFFKATYFNKYHILKEEKHKKLLSVLENKKKIRVLFLAINKSVWKVDSIFEKMLEDPYFEPLILVCPYTAYGEERMWEDMNDTFKYFKDKEYPVILSYNKEKNDWLKLSELEPDIIFCTNPYKITKKYYYEDAFMNYLSCYVPYFYLITTHDDEQPIYNQLFHNMMWKIFLPHEISLFLTKKISTNQGKNALLTGYPFCESLLKENNKNLVWKYQATKKIRIIYAPHHSINNKEELQLSTFLRYAYFFKDISNKFKHETQWCFKPHPILKSKLYSHHDWGKIKTDEYYKYWENSVNTQFDDGEYIDLFKQSDCMIHDSGSFLVEYLFMKKPVMYLMTTQTEKNLNKFGLEALKCCIMGYNEEDIKDFIYKLIRNEITEENEKNFIEKHIDKFFKHSLPSEKIISYIKNKIMRK
ncbi:CDP-glycerol glycerophosphotransferase family protein [Aliarcobacter skirrowii]|uniref:CDP-glycerol glycerophosphotransferase family protein n=1 Tax=Aliarcobacter skirrowii TaxID=28200 RepID=UPI0029AF0B86|nr:CDP-glycerol glycerophosphotransferase family protein [Aliarcobacter skirrowii]MDX4060330.1 CDP-glycerol glycerophosphotransferase family protein [Aliarcobacter skirrowii]